MRNIRFANGEFYHVYNRGVDKRAIFQDSYDLERFLRGMREFNSRKPIGSIFQNSFRDKVQLSNRVAKLVDIVSFCLNPNHYHMILMQKTDNGISEFMHRVGTGYTQFFNLKCRRTGSLFQGKFKAIHINSNEYLLHLSAYVNLNNKVHRIKNNKLTKSSWEEYVERKDFMCSKNIILEQFDNIEEYKEFAQGSLQDILNRRDLRKEMEDMMLE